uniref:Uncharacterized protein n=1 Tax=Setaria italica TaxID=4555 RepID=K3YNU6_SETIT
MELEFQLPLSLFLSSCFSLHPSIILSAVVVGVVDSRVGGNGGVWTGAVGLLGARSRVLIRLPLPRISRGEREGGKQVVASMRGMMDGM